MTLSEAIATPVRHRSSRRVALKRADLGDLVVELQARMLEQIGEHAEMSRLIIEDRGREAVMDTSFARSMENARHQVAFGDRPTMDAALDRVERVHNIDEAAEDALIVGLLSLVGVHNVAAHDLRRLVQANGTAITDGDPVVGLDSDDDDAIPTSMIRRQQRARA